MIIRYKTPATPPPAAAAAAAATATISVLFCTSKWIDQKEQHKPQCIWIDLEDNCGTEMNLSVEDMSLNYASQRGASDLSARYRITLHGVPPFLSLKTIHLGLLSRYLIGKLFSLSKE
jgi:hypothetical protein